MVKIKISDVKGDYPIEMDLGEYITYFIQKIDKLEKKVAKLEEGLNDSHRKG